MIFTSVWFSSKIFSDAIRVGFANCGQAAAFGGGAGPPPHGLLSLLAEFGFSLLIQSKDEVRAKFRDIGRYRPQCVSSRIYHAQQFDFLFRCHHKGEARHLMQEGNKLI